MPPPTAPTPADLDSAYRRQRRPALRRARRWFPSLSEPDLEDLYQAAWLSVVRAQGEVVDLDSYLNQALYSHGLMELRRRRRKPAGSLERRADAAPVSRNGAREEAAVDRTAPLPSEQAETRALAALAEEILDELTPRERTAVKLRWGWDFSWKEIAALVGTSPRAVKRDLVRAGSKITAEKDAFANGGWCRRKRSLITAYALQLVGPARAASAERHLRSCSACRQLVRELRAHVDEVAALAPAPALVEPSAHGPLARIVDLLEGARTQAADMGSAARHHATSLAVRGADPTPLSGVRPGAAAAAITGCLAIGGGATYCIEQGVDPVNGVGGLFGKQAANRRSQPPTLNPHPDQPPAPPEVPRSAPPPPQPGPTQPQQTEQAPQPPPPPPAAENEFEPSSATAGATSTGRVSASGGRGAPAPAAGPGEFDGP